jgi:hypothetical protein
VPAEWSAPAEQAPAAEALGRHRTAVGRVACPRRVRAVSAPATQQVEHNQPDSHQGKEDEQVPDDFHRRFHHPRKRLGECARQRRLGGIGKSTGRGGAMRSTKSAPLGWGLGRHRPAPQ